MKTSEELINSFIEKMNEKYQEKTREFVVNPPEEFKIDVDIIKDDIGVADIRFWYNGGSDIDIREVRYEISDSIDDAVYPRSYTKEVEEIVATRLFEKIVEEKKYSNDDCKKVVISRLIHDRVNLWQDEFKEKLISELLASNPVNISSQDIDSEQFEVLEYMDELTGDENWNETDKLLVEYFDNQALNAEQAASNEISRLSNLSNEEKNKINAYMKENLNRKRPETVNEYGEEYIVDEYNGKNVEERIEHLDDGIKKSAKFRKELSYGVYKRSFCDMFDEFYDNDYIFSSIKNKIYHFCLAQAYPNGIVNNGKYTNEIIEDSVIIVCSTNTYKNMVGSAQEEVINKIKNINSLNAESKVDSFIERMANGEDVLGEGQNQEQNISNKQMGYTMVGLVGFIAGVLSVGIIILGVLIK